MGCSSSIPENYYTFSHPYDIEYSVDYYENIKNGLKYIESININDRLSINLLEHSRLLKPDKWEANYYIAYTFYYFMKPWSYIDIIKYSELALKYSDTYEPYMNNDIKLKVKNMIESSNNRKLYEEEILKNDLLKKSKLQNYIIDFQVDFGGLLYDWKLQNEKFILISVPLSFSSQSIAKSNVKIESNIAKASSLKIEIIKKIMDKSNFLELACYESDGTTFTQFPRDLILFFHYEVDHDLSGSLQRSEIIDVTPIEDMAVVMARIRDMSDVDKYRIRPYVNPNECPYMDGDSKFRRLVEEITLPVDPVEHKVALFLDYIRANFKYEDKGPQGHTMSEVLAHGSGNSIAFAFLAMCCFRLLKIPSKVVYGISGKSNNSLSAKVAVWHEHSLSWIICDPQNKLWGGAVDDFIPTTFLRDEEAWYRDEKGVFVFDMSILWKSGKNLSFQNVTQ